MYEDFLFIYIYSQLNSGWCHTVIKFHLYIYSQWQWLKFMTSQCEVGQIIRQVLFIVQAGVAKNIYSKPGNIATVVLLHFTHTLKIKILLLLQMQAVWVLLCELHWEMSLLIFPKVILICANLDKPLVMHFHLNRLIAW